MIRIEHYSENYYDDVVRLIKNFHNEALNEYGASFSEAALLNTISLFRGEKAENSYLLIIKDKCEGALAGVAANSFSSKDLLFQELIWYVNEPYRRYGIILLNKVEEDLKRRGFSSLVMAVLENSKAEKIKTFYERTGFKKMETHYLKNL